MLDRPVAGNNWQPVSQRVGYYVSIKWISRMTH